MHSEHRKTWPTPLSTTYLSEEELHVVEAVLHEGEGGGYAGEAAGRRAVGPVIVGAPPLLPQPLPLPGHRVQLGVDLVHDVPLLPPRVNIQQNCLWI